jgi:hypothetical protein
MKKIILFSLILLSGCAFQGCSNPTQAMATLKGQGYTNCQLQGYDGFGCTGDDMSSDGFTCLGKDGGFVSGDVCCGMSNGCTIRTK